LTPEKRSGTWTVSACNRRGAAMSPPPGTGPRLCRTVDAAIARVVVTPGDAAGYVAECADPVLVTQGGTLDEVVANVREALALALEDRPDQGRSHLRVVITLDVELRPRDK
jgi:predicted RNase H-like HicB family nuclease